MICIDEGLKSFHGLKKQNERQKAKAEHEHSQNYAKRNEIMQYYDWTRSKNGDIFYDKNEARFCITRLQSVDTNFFCNVNHFVPVPSGYLPNFNTFDIYNRLMRNYVSNLELWVGYLAVADTVTYIMDPELQ